MHAISYMIHIYIYDVIHKYDPPLCMYVYDDTLCMHACHGDMRIGCSRYRGMCPLTAGILMYVNICQAVGTFAQAAC